MKAQPVRSPQTSFSGLLAVAQANLGALVPSLGSDYTVVMILHMLVQLHLFHHPGKPIGLVAHRP